MQHGHEDDDSDGSDEGGEGGQDGKGRRRPSGELFRDFEGALDLGGPSGRKGGELWGRAYGRLCIRA